MRRPSRYGRPDPEKLDDTPIEMPLGARRPRPLQELIARMVKEAVEDETGEEFDDIEEEDDFEEEDPDTLDFSPYEFAEIQEEYPVEQEPAPPKARPVKEVLDEAYGEGNYPSHWLGETGDAPDQNEQEPS
jgi:hypothetical protein